MTPGRRLLPLLAACGLGACLAARAADVPPPLAATLRDTLKGDSRFADAPEWPQGQLPLAAPAPEPGAGEAADAVRCGPRLASVPMPIGARDQFAAVRGAGLGVLEKLASIASGGRVGAPQPARDAQATSPVLRKDPIPSRYRSEVKDRPSGIRLDLGAELQGNELLLSSRLDSVSGKGTVHEVYLERSDCRRIYPTAEYAYELWGSWSLSVSWTRSESTYQNGQLVNRQSSSGGFRRAGTWGPGGSDPIAAADAAFAGLPPDLAGPARRYQAALRQEMTLPLWQRLGFGAPTSGARAVGSVFRLSDGDLAAIQGGRMAAIVQVTREHGPLYEAVGVPVALAPAKDAHLAFAALNAAAR